MLLERDSDPSALPTGRSAKTARAYAKSYASGPPLVPAIIVERVLQYIAKVSVRKKPELVLQVCKYWSLKREARRGAPLLKRLHLEPWTATAGGAGQSDEEKGMKLEVSCMFLLRMEGWLMGERIANEEAEGRAGARAEYGRFGAATGGGQAAAS